MPNPPVGVQQLFNKRLWTGMDGMKPASKFQRYIFGALSYSQASWLLTRGGSEVLGKSRLPPSIPKRRALMGPMAGLDNADEAAAGTADPRSARGASSSE